MIVCYRKYIPKSVVNVMLSIVLMVLSSSVLESPASDLRIVGGRDAAPGEFPYVVILEIRKGNEKKFDSCTASVLTPSWTLTAGSCLSGSHASKANKYADGAFEKGDDIPAESIKYVIRYELISDNKREDKYTDVLKIVPFPRERPVSVMVEDIALLNTDSIKVKSYAKLSALHYSAMSGHEVKVLGFGIMKSNDNINKTFDQGKPLQVGNGMITQCDSEMGYPSLCVVPSCSSVSQVADGDSGGPIVHLSGIVAVVVRSSGQLYISKVDFVPVKEAAFVTPVCPYLNWIAKTIGVVTDIA